MKKLTFLLFILVLSVGCQKQSRIKNTTWRTGDSQSLQKKLLSVEVENISKSTQLDQRSIVIVRQTVNGIPIENSFIKKVKKENEYQLIQAETYKDSVSDFFLKDQPKMSYESEIKNKIQKARSDFRKIELIQTEKIYVLEDERLESYQKALFFTSSGEPYSVYFDKYGQASQIKRVGSHFAPIHISVYAEGPKLGNLTDQVLHGLNTTPTLSNEKLYVESAAGLKIEALSDVMKFDPQDPRFDQIQVFYYLHKSLTWMKDQLKVTLPERLHAVVHMGHPEKTNSSFYFQNRIRIGSGDDVAYSQIPKDPSIIVHESFHALIDSLARLSNEGEGGSLNEAFADFFTCLQLGRPYLGEVSYLQGPYKRSLLNTKKFQDRNGGLYGDSLIFSGFMWEVKENLGFERSKELALSTLVELNPSSRFNEFIESYRTNAEKILTAEQYLVVERIMKARGFIK